MSDLKETSPTNSSIGCQHWYNTLLSQIARIGESINNGTIDKEILKSWGKVLKENADHLIKNYDKIPKPFEAVDKPIPPPIEILADGEIPKFK